MNNPDILKTALQALGVKDYAKARQVMAGYSYTEATEPLPYLMDGLAALALHIPAEAEAIFQQAVARFPHQPQLWLNLAAAQEQTGALSNAAASNEAALRLQPDGKAFTNLANIYRQLKKFSDAERCAKAGIVFEEVAPQALNSLGLALGKQGKFAEADAAFIQSLDLIPAQAEVLANRANLAVDQLKFDEAWDLFAQARQITDMAVIRLDEGMARLLAGDHANGWALFESRLEIAGALRQQPTCPRYTGEDLRGKTLLLIAEQGFGDTIMFCRYGQIFIERGADLIWSVQQPLKRLLEGHLPGQVFAEGERMPKVDYYLPLMSAPFALGLVKPLKADAYLKLGNAQEKDNGLKRKIGLVFSGSKTHDRDHERSVAPQMFAPLCAAIDADFYALGLEDSIDLPLKRLQPPTQDFADTAVVINQMDCVVTVDTAVAHLAGALGVPTYLLLPHCPDWRWGVSGTVTGWYQNMTVLRQPRYGDWQSAIENLIVFLRD